MATTLRRRDFLKTLGAAGAASAFGLRGFPAIGKPGSANERLNLGIIGTSGRAEGNIEGVQGENLVALCDIDDRLLGRAAGRFPGAKTFVDFRKLLDHPGLDAVVISTADHTHAPAAVGAIRRGLHVYCEKPLSHSVYEARVATEAAREKKVATQLGTQIHAGDNYRRVVELVRAGAVGPVREVHVWCGKSWSGGERPGDAPPVPEYLHWDLWLGPAPERPYHPTYQPANWRRWWDFGSGTLGDMACHYMDLPFWALDLKYPTAVESEGPPVHPETTPEWLIVRYEFPARGEKPPVALTWYDGGKRPEILKKAGMPDWGDGVLFVGDDGMLIADYDNRRLLPEGRFRDFKPPEPSIPASIGHHAEWIAACKDGRPTTCRFDYSGPLTEAVLLGNVAYRAGSRLEWDAETLRAGNCPEAEEYLRRDYRKGWEL
jgi:predicted dehydrogenase